ncbi:hypothetical protein [Domibacillus enclensis]|uniref:Uncharacterized protein n=1 Tax=Domibacillus enclensis TaxID=1017273 RepID=A0A1N7C098_9BACI|nr:hypothetical protein [Domibacillus enclensis]OXS74183.1 hypothetical protein B1B05_17055 [Domibacillus enclensis]SIR56985.1 hypothetical protein SAMN05443094_1112 [Domibacillus enclensis]
MLIRPYHRYTVLVEDSNHIQYVWHLNVLPHKKAWRVANLEMNWATVFKGYLILDIEELDGAEVGIDEETDEDLHISMDDFHMAVGMSGIGYAVDPLYSTSYRCQICGGIVANDICTDCMFDWDS